ncbi:MAG TPA: ABC transporter ATP-binding protein [Polyangiales bacterium]|nr:ABC transporter ATP-binding protein [Polyangiales bacterium]
MNQPDLQQSSVARTVLVQPAGPRGNVTIERAKDARGTLRRLWSYFSPFHTGLSLIAACVLVYTLLGLLGPYLMGRAIDRFIAERDPVGLGHTALMMLGAFVLSNVFQFASAWLMAGLSQRALQSLRGKLFEHLQELPIAFFDGQSAGELMSRLTNDIDAINQAVAQNITALLASALSMGGILITMFVLDVWLALASVLVVPIMLWFTRFIAVYTRRGFRDVQRELGSLNGVMEEAISGQKVVKAFGRSDAVIENFRAQNQAVYRASLYANTYALLLMPLTAVLGNLFVIVLAGLGGWLALQGLVSVGIIATFINYGQNFVGPLRQISNLYNTIQAALAGAERVFDTLDRKPELERAERSFGDGLRGRVRFEHVTFGYRPEAPIIHDMSLDVQPGQMIALVGPTGAGKTTIVNLLTRFYELDAGRITIDDIDIRDVSRVDLRRRLGIVLQNTVLFSDTILENIRYGRLDASDEQVIEAAKLADADHFIRRLPHGYHTRLSERAANLSQGQRQLLAIARTLLADPAILILDEATSSVDTRTEARIQRSLLRLMQGRTSFVIAHRLSTIRDADQVVVIRDGAIVERGTHDQLIAAHGFYQQLYVSQFKGQAI